MLAFVFFSSFTAALGGSFSGHSVMASHETMMTSTRSLFTDCAYQVLCHLHCNRGDFLTVFTDHLLYDIGEVVVLRLPHDVQECLHHWPDEGGDVFFG